jgi:hypothetical protein
MSDPGRKGGPAPRLLPARGHRSGSQGYRQVIENGMIRPGPML